MKNKGMHQQPNAFSPSGAPPKAGNVGHSHTPSPAPQQQSWNKSQPAPTGTPKGSGKHGKKAA
jgi:hypothetical protein